MSFKDKKRGALNAVTEAMKNPTVQSATTRLSMEDKNSNTPPKEAPKEKSKPAKASTTKTKVTPPSQKPLTPKTADKKNISIRIKIYDRAEVEKALDIAQKANAQFNQAIRSYADRIISTFKSKIEDDVSSFESHGNTPTAEHYFMSTVTLLTSDIEALKTAIDPYNLFSDGQVVNDALNQISAKLSKATD